MSEDWNEIDQVFQDSLGGYEVQPPESVWENIQAERTFGHIVTNRISNNWNIFGTLLFLLLIGGSAAISFGIEEHIEEEAYITFDAPTIQETSFRADVPEIQSKEEVVSKHTISKLSTLRNDVTTTEEEVRLLEENEMPDVDLIASIHAAGFSRPKVADKRLSAYIETLNGWESASPKGYTRYTSMEVLKKSPVHKKALNAKPVQATVDYDYVREAIRSKPFKERLSLLVSFTPQSIHKSMVANYNLSSDYIKERHKREKTRLAYSFNASLQYEFSNHKFIETGVMFTQIYEELHIEGEKRFSNQYDFFEIPVLFGFEQRNAKWGWHVKGGIGVQIRNTYKGYILNPEEDIREPNTQRPSPQFRLKNTDALRNIITNNHRLAPTQDRDEVLDLSNEEENPYKSSGVFNIHMATGLTYYHSIRTNFLITPYYRRSVNSISKEGARFREHISYTGISLGARFKF